MRRFLVLGLLMVIGVALVAQLPAVGTSDSDGQNENGHASDSQQLLEWEVMSGLFAPFVGSSANAIRGVTGAGAPWKIVSGKGSLQTDGTLEIEVRGLVLTNTGLNPVANFRAIVSCVTVVNGAAANANVSTGFFAATVPGGDSNISERINLPNPCIAPIVFVTSPGGSWFAVTGR